MSVAVRVTCDVPDCGRHFDIDVQSPAVTDLVHLGPSGGNFWVEVLLETPEGWDVDGTGFDFRATCADHLGAETR